MPKKKKVDSIEDILDRIEEDIMTIREKLDDQVEDEDSYEDEDDDE
jgi:septation ring formation regulator EzrA